MGTQDADSSGMSPLQALITTQMRRKGWSMQDVEARGVPHATLHRYTQPRRLKGILREATVKQLSTALELDEEAIWDAAFLSTESKRGITGTLELSGSVGDGGEVEPYATREAALRDASLDELLAEVARRANRNNPEAP